MQDEMHHLRDVEIADRRRLIPRRLKPTLREVDVEAVLLPNRADAHWNDCQ